LKKSLFALLLSIVQGASVLGGEPQSTIAANDATSPATDDQLPFKIWWVPPTTFTGPGVKRLAPDNNSAWDLRAWFARQGLTLGREEGAWYDRPSAALVVQAKPATLDLVDQLGFRGWTNRLRLNVRAEVVFVEFSAAAQPGIGRNSVAKLRQEAGRSWRVIHRMAILAQSGQRTVSGSTTPAVAAKAAPAAADASAAAADAEPASTPIEHGPSLEIIPIALQEEDLIDINLFYDYRAPSAPGWDWKATLSVQAHDGAPILLQMDTDPVHPEKRRALILRVDLVYLRHPVIYPLPRGRSRPGTVPFTTDRRLSRNDAVGEEN
jgi:hypothetical protein